MREEVKMENGRSPVLGSGLSESDGAELMEGAAAAAGVGRNQSHSTVSLSSSHLTFLHLTVSSFSLSQVLWSFR